MKTIILLAAIILGCASLEDFQTNDIGVLNYALTLEHLEYAFYRDGLNNLTSQRFTDAGYNSSVFTYIQFIMMHEGNHVDFLTRAITDRGGVPVKECVYNFATAYSSVSNFLALAAVLENVGVGAYDGAINRITELALQTAAATVATVEARHAAYLNLLNNQVPFPSAFDNATTPDLVIDAASTFIASCDANTSAANIRPQVANFTANAPINASAANANDLAVLKYALTLEQLEYTFYTQGLANFTVEQFIAEGFNASVREYITLVQSHEQTHVTTLASVIPNNDVLPCRYDFHYTNVTTFLRVASLLENTGVEAYDGAVNGISSLDYRQVAATIATVEGRHAAYLNLVIAANPFPLAFDIAANQTTILNAALSFIIPDSCPYNLAEVNFVAANFSPATITTTTESSTGATVTTSAVTGDAITTSVTVTTSATTGNATTTGSASTSTSGRTSSAGKLIASAALALSMVFAL